MLGRRWLSLLLLALVAVVWPSRASAWTSANAQTRVGVFDVAAHAVVGLASARSPGNHRAPSLARSQLASDNALAAEGLEATAQGVAPAVEKSFFEGTQYTQKVLTQMQGGVGEFHSFPESVTAFESAGSVRTITGGDGVVRQMLEIPGSYGARDGVFQFIKEADGAINHRLFVPGPGGP